MLETMQFLTTPVIVLGISKDANRRSAVHALCLIFGPFKAMLDCHSLFRSMPFLLNIVFISWLDRQLATVPSSISGFSIIKFTIRLSGCCRSVFLAAIW